MHRKEMHERKKGTDVPLNEVPEIVTKTVNRVAPDATVEKVALVEREEKKFYRITCDTPEGGYMIKTTDEGVLIMAGNSGMMKKFLGEKRHPGMKKHRKHDHTC